MRTLFISLLTVLFACPALGQDTEGKYTLTSGHLQMVVAAEYASFERIAQVADSVLVMILFAFEG